MYIFVDIQSYISQSSSQKNSKFTCEWLIEWLCRMSSRSCISPTRTWPTSLAAVTQPDPRPPCPPRTPFWSAVDMKPKIFMLHPLPSLSHSKALYLAYIHWHTHARTDTYYTQLYRSQSFARLNLLPPPPPILRLSPFLPPSFQSSLPPSLARRLRFA